MIYQLQVTESHYQPGDLTTTEQVVVKEKWPSLSQAMGSLAVQIARYEHMHCHLYRIMSGTQSQFYQLDRDRPPQYTLQWDGTPVPSTLHSVEIAFSYHTVSPVDALRAIPAGERA